MYHGSRTNNILPGTGDKIQPERAEIVGRAQSLTPSEQDHIGMRGHLEPGPLSGVITIRVSIAQRHVPILVLLKADIIVMKI